ncbi:hypothetical protein Alide_1642 [Alicycliphilus denitrificans BC]|nr:hypothetical protein Alide_1642 [Alicycliphilus denitrificans BC]
MARLADTEVERRLGYTPCVCGQLDGTWHPECYRNKTRQQTNALTKKAIQKAREQFAAEDRGIKKENGNGLPT